MSLIVISPGPLTTVQDLGRLGYQRFGVPQSGAMDEFALRAANRLVGNPPEAAGLEFALDAPVLQAGEDCLAALAGRGYSMQVQDRRVGAWRAALVRRGEVIRFLPDGSPGWGCLALLGGVDVPPLMGSRSTYIRGGFGGWRGRVLRAGDALPVGADRPRGWKAWAGRWLASELRPAYADSVTLRVILGPQLESFTAEALETFLSAEYSVSPASDRMGYRLAGPRLIHRGSADLLSEALAWGALQVPADGLPMAMMSDRPTTGGYPKIATVARCDLPLLAQAMPGSGLVRFQSVTLAEAQQRYHDTLDRLETGFEGDDDAYD